MNGSGFAPGMIDMIHTTGLKYSYHDLPLEDIVAVHNVSDYVSGSTSAEGLSSMCNISNPVPKVRQITKTLDLYLVPIIIVVGLIGNTISFMVFVRTNLRKLSASVYLAALAVSDNGFLLCVFLSWSSRPDVGLNLYNRQGWCQTFVYLSYVCSFLSVWYVIGFTVERYIAICFPFKRGTMCTVRRAQMSVVGLAVVAALLYVWGIWTSRPQTLECSGVVLCHIDTYHQQLINAMSNIDTVCTLLVPCPAIFILNLRIIWVLSRHRGAAPDRHRPAYKQEQTRSSDRMLKDANSARHLLPKHPKSTRMLLVVSSVFLALNLPAHSLRIFFFFTAIVDIEYIMSLGEEYVALQEFFTYLFYANFSINIFLYSLCGANFRRSVFALFFPQRLQQKSVFRNCSQDSLRTRDRLAWFPSSDSQRSHRPIPLIRSLDYQDSSLNSSVRSRTDSAVTTL